MGGLPGRLQAPMRRRVLPESRASCSAGYAALRRVCERRGAVSGASFRC